MSFVVRRGVSDYPIPELGKNLSEVSVGDVFTNGSFLSTSVRVDKGFTLKCNLIIVVPKGAHGIYAEPFSHYTDHNKYDYAKNNLWDVLANEYMGKERECGLVNEVVGLRL